MYHVSNTNSLVRSALKTHKLDKTVIDACLGKIENYKTLDNLVINKEQLEKRVEKTDTGEKYVFESSSYTLEIQPSNNYSDFFYTTFTCKLPETKDNLGKVKQLEIKKSNKDKIAFKLIPFNKVVNNDKTQYYPYILCFKQELTGPARFYLPDLDQFEYLEHVNKSYVRTESLFKEEESLNYKVESLIKIADFNINKFIENRYQLDEKILIINDKNKQNIQDLWFDAHTSYENPEDYLKKFTFFNYEYAIDKMNEIKNIFDHIKNGIFEKINNNVCDLTRVRHLKIDEDSKVSFGMNSVHTACLLVKNKQEEAFFIKIENDKFDISLEKSLSFKLNTDNNSIVIEENDIVFYLKEESDRIAIEDVIVKINFLNKFNFREYIESLDNKVDLAVIKNSISNYNFYSYKTVEDYFKILCQVTLNNNLDLNYIVRSNFIIDNHQKDLLILMHDYNLNENTNFAHLEKSFKEIFNKNVKDSNIIKRRII